MMDLSYAFRNGMTLGIDTWGSIVLRKFNENEQKLDIDKKRKLLPSVEAPDEFL